AHRKNCARKSHKKLLALFGGLDALEFFERRAGAERLVAGALEPYESNLVVSGEMVESPGELTQELTGQAVRLGMRKADFCDSLMNSKCDFPRAIGHGRDYPTMSSALEA